ncbi:hypothetical protein JQC92_21550, partial [Shewanella sp. 202IG2-18]|uniref:hypothetical protein n=1 Tax=Parashewanella hymeniacidonis TaxID=2807618 RepID=UPI001961D976
GSSNSYSTTLGSDYFLGLQNVTSKSKSCVTSKYLLECFLGCKDATEPKKDILFLILFHHLGNSS